MIVRKRVQLCTAQNVFVMSSMVVVGVQKDIWSYVHVITNNDLFTTQSSVIVIQNLQQVCDEYCLFCVHHNSKMQLPQLYINA